MSTSTSAARCSAGSVRSARAPPAPLLGDRAVGRVLGLGGGGRQRAAAAVLVEVVGQRLGAAYLRGPDPVQAGVDHDPVQPGGHRGLAAERARPAVRRDQAVLEAVGGVLGVAHGAQRDRPEPVAVAGEQHTEGVGVTVRRGPRAARRRSARRAAGVVRRSAADHDLGDLAPEAAVHGRERGQPDDEEAAGGRLVEGDPGPRGRRRVLGCDRLRGPRRRSARCR